MLASFLLRFICCILLNFASMKSSYYVLKSMSCHTRVPDEILAKEIILIPVISLHLYLHHTQLAQYSQNVLSSRQAGHRNRQQRPKLQGPLALCMLGGSGGMLPQKILKIFASNGCIWCILGLTETLLDSIKIMVMKSHTRPSFSN